MPLGAFRLNSIARFTVTAVAEVIRLKKGITAVGDAQVDTAQSKFGGASAVFDGTGDHLNVRPNINLSNTDYTLECWVRMAVDQGFETIFDFRTASTDTGVFLGYHTSNYLYVFYNGSTTITGSNSLSTNTWYHVALIRNSGVTKLYLDGVQEGSNWTDNNTYSDRPLKIGSAFDNDSEWNGHIDEVRISNTARYTTTFTPSTTPFQNDSNTLLLLHMDGTDASTVFTDDNGVRAPRGIVAVGNAQVDTAQSKFGGASALFDGTSDYLRVFNPGFNWGTGNFTVEAYVRHNAINDQQVYWDFRSSSTNHHIFYVKSDNKLEYYDGSNTYTSTETMAANTWYHLAISRSGSSLKIFRDGTALITQTNSRNQSSTGTGTIGSSYDLAAGNSVNGWMDEVRVSNTARYTADFTPSTTPFVNDENTLLLLHMDGTDASTYFEDDNGVRTPVGVIAGGSGQVDTAQSQFGGASLTVANVDYIYTGSAIGIPTTGAFTVEMWVYFDDTAPFQTFFDTRPTSTNGNYITLFLETGELKFYTSSNRRISEANPGAIVATTWAHVALVRDGNDHKLYLNGTQVSGTWTSSQTYVDNRIVIGHDSFQTLGNGTNSFDGNIDEVRISNVARYTTAFTPSTTPFQNDSNTLLLLHMDGTDASTVFIDDNGVAPDHNYS